MQPSLYVIIVTYNGAAWARRCLGSVYQSSIEATPIVVDNDSSDNTLDIIREEFPKCVIIETRQNLGFGKANNLGIRKALQEGAEYIYLLNQDAWVEPDAFEIMIQVQKLYPIYGILSPIQMTGDGTNYDSNFLNHSISEKCCPGCLTDIKSGCSKDVYESKAVIAAHWLVYAPYLRRVGLFSPAFPHYGEDSNLYQRFMYWGYKVGICPKAIAYHDRQDRITTPEQNLYRIYITFLTFVNNVLLNSNLRIFRAYCGFVRRTLIYSQCSLKRRLEFVWLGTKSYMESNKFKREYRIENNTIWKM
jgi:GT2 family glycosyltransferase